MKKKFNVLMEAKVSVNFDIEADSMEQAVLIAQRDHSKLIKEVSLNPTWVEEREILDDLGEYSVSFEGLCDCCKQPMFESGERVDGSIASVNGIGGFPTQSQVGDGLNRYYFTWCNNCMKTPLKQLADTYDE